LVLNAATTIKLVEHNSWQAIVGGSVGYLLPSRAAAGGFDYGGQVSLYNKYQRRGGLDPLKTGIDLGMTYRQQDHSAWLRRICWPSKALSRSSMYQDFRPIQPDYRREAG
jgi:hypothetical protein